jgi:hypothetical protein
MKKRLAFPIVMLIVASLAACNLPTSADATETPMSIDAAFTAAAQTVEAQFTSNALTQAAAGPVATNTPLPATITSTPRPAVSTNTPLATPISTQSCDVAQFVSDVTVPDNTNFNPGDTFTKTWRIKNVGTCSWTSSYTLVFASDNQMNGPSSVALTGNVNPGDTVDLSVNLTAPGTAGTYTGNWKLRNAAGLSFGYMYVKIVVGGGGTGAGTATATTTAASFGVTHIGYTTSGGCTSALTVIAQVQVNGAGTVGYHWVRSDGATDTDIHPALVFSAAGTQSISTTWNISASGTNWIGVYIDDPNHQQIGKAEFTCP